MNPQEPQYQPPSGVFRIGEWRVDPALDELYCGAQDIKLEPRMMRLLCRLAESPGQVVSTPQLLDSVWSGVVVGPASVYQAISALRKILGDTGESPTYIATVARRGYRLVAPVERPTGPVANNETQGDSASPRNSANAHPRRFSPTHTAAVIFAAVAIIATLIVFLIPGRKAPSPSAEKVVEAAWPAPDLPSMSIVPLRPGAPDPANDLFAATFTDILENRLIAQHGLLLVSLFSAEEFRRPDADVRSIGNRLRVDYVLRGDAARDADRIRVNISVVDARSGAPIWSQRFERDVQEVSRLREEIVSRLGTLLQVRMEPGGNTPVDLDAHQEYVRGMRAFQKGTTDGYGEARDIFQRATELYPDYPRNYFGLSIAVKMFEWFPDPRRVLTTEQRVALQRASVERALQLDPRFGEAILERAMITPDPQEAERLLLQGMDMVPSSGFGPYFYTTFLKNQGRDGEAIAAIERGLRIDPLSTVLLIYKAYYLVEYRGDVAGQQAVLREIIANNERAGDAASWLGVSLYTNSGETAEAIRVLEREAARDPKTFTARSHLVFAYLEVDDPAAAAAAGKGLPDTDFFLARHRGAARPLAVLSKGWQEHWPQEFHYSPESFMDSLRDEAMATGRYATTLEMFEKGRSTYPRVGVLTISLDLRYAHTLLLSGDTDRGREMVKTVLHTMEVEQVGRPPYAYARPRAMAYAMLGDDRRALDELATSVQHNDIVRWRYTAGQDPTFARVRKDPRFQALARTVERHRERQRDLLEEMRQKGEVPKRP